MNKRLKSLIKVMFDIDQDLRLSTKPGKTKENYLLYAIDNSHNNTLKTLIASYGYPSQESVGKEGMFQFWLLIQHQDFDLDLQKLCLEKCDFGPTEVAFLKDRILNNQDLEQEYGTQFHKVNGKYQPFPIKDAQNVNERRKSVGIKPLEEEIAEWNTK